EFCMGIESLPASRRRRELDRYRRDLVDWNIPILPFDQAAAEWLATERARLGRKGLVPAYRDATIAAIAAARNLIVVTRNLADYKLFRGVRLENWFRKATF